MGEFKIVKMSNIKLYDMEGNLIVDIKEPKEVKISETFHCSKNNKE